MRSLLQKIATGPELSKDISADEARAGMQLILRQEVDPVQAALFLIALRMKRETDAEVLGVHSALLDAAQHVEVPIDELVEIADPFNGYNRGLPVSPFLPALLAACGVAACGHGVKTAGPKHGITHHKVLRAVGVDVETSMVDAAKRIADPGIGWAYVDQSVSNQSLHQLLQLRDLMVKRTCLTTIEVALKPFRARNRTHLVTGYVHKAYPPVYASLARHADYQSAMIVRGVEGGVVPSLQQPSKIVRCQQGQADQDWRVEPGMVGVRGAAHRAVPLPDVLLIPSENTETLDVDKAALAAAEVGLAALRGEPGPAFDSLIYSGALILTHLRQGSIDECAGRVRQVLRSGAAAARLNAG